MHDATVAVDGCVLLHPLAFCVEEGQHWLVCGPNGAGKSTLLALITGDHPQAYANDIRVMGHALGAGYGRNQRRALIGHMSPELAWHYPGGWALADVVCSGVDGTLGVHRRGATGDVGRLAWLLETFNLTQVAGAPFGNLTEPEQRCALIARALLESPPLVLLDEPTQGLDAAERERVWEAVDETVKSGPTTLLMVSHYREERPRCITHELVLEGGRAAYCGPLRGAATSTRKT
jgi:molybdate transport system ATP-binding protein